MFDVSFSRFNRVKDSLSTLPNAVNAILSTKVALGRLVVYLNQGEIEDANWDITDQTIILNSATVSWPKGEGDEQDTTVPPFKLRDMTLTVPEKQFTLVCGSLGSGKTLLASTVRLLQFVSLTASSSAPCSEKLK